jgi:glycosyltransferase involved in cell wall biosynthesis
MRIKVMFFIATLNGGGAERVTVTLIRELNPKKFDIYLVLVNKEGVFFELIPNYVKIIELKSTRTLFSIISLRKVIRDIQPDIIYSTLFRTHIAIELSIKGIHLKPKRIYRSPTSPKILLERGEINSFMRYLISRAYQNADMVLAQTSDMKKEIVKYHNIDNNKVVTFINPIDKDLIDNQIKNSLNPFDDSFINIVGAGRLSALKGFDTLLYAFKKVLDKNDKFFLHIIGRDGGEQLNLEKIANELSISHRVKFWGFQKNPYRFFYYTQLYILSSRREGLPNTVLENQYIGKPIVATRCISFMDELIDNGINGWVVDVDDINALSSAILNYKKLNIKNSKTRRDNSLDINILLLDIIKR